MQVDDCHCMLNEVDMFSALDKQIELDDGYWEDIHPLNNVSSEGPIEFSINKLNDEFIDLNNCMLHVQVKIVNNANDAKLKTTDVIAPVNNWFHSLFSDINLTISNVYVEGESAHYPYKA